MMVKRKTKIWKYLKYTLAAILVIFVIAASVGIQKFNNSLFGEKPNLLTFTHEPKPITFAWANDSIDHYYETKAAIIIPLRIKALAHKFYMQFDTGAPYSYIYEKDLLSLKKIGLKLEEVVKEESRYIKHLEFELGGNKVSASMIKILDNYGHTFSATDTIGNLKIGTIGSDLLDDCITAIDFANQQIQIYQNRPDWMTSLSPFQPFDFKGRRIMLPAVVDGKNLELLYDSGCSAFGIITTRNRFKRYTNEETEAVEYGANSWGSSIPILSKTTNEPIQIGSTNLSMERASYVNMYAWTQRFVTPFTRIGGWLGNRPFVESTLILDTKTEEFTIVKSALLENLQ
ncbi:hypothetical protein BFP97_03790 [Roseivirga sp. 4D4]|nr:hypothetical protein BFP97_03790 [Roseivirga sp. 4D4]